VNTVRHQVLLLLACCGHGEARPTRSKPMSGADEQLVRDRVQRMGKSLDRIEASSLPGFYRAVFLDGVEDFAIVRGRMIDERGLPALAGYLREIGFLALKEVDVAMLMRLCASLGAMPPSPQGELQYLEYGDTALVPRFERRDGGARLVLSTACGRRPRRSRTQSSCRRKNGRCRSRPSASCAGRGGMRRCA
jgi:hypothetical protein